MRWLGVDGGGTKTRFDLYDGDMNLLQTLRLPTCHVMQVGADGMRTVLEEGVRTLTAGSDEPVGIGFGLAGYGADPRLRAQIGAVVADVAAGRPYELVNDVEAAWASGLGLADGIVVICGTGSIAYGRHGERSCRTGGWGFQVGDEGSGYWIGRETLRLFSRQADGRDVRGPLYDTVMERLKLDDPYGVIAYVRDEMRGDRTKIASLTRVLKAAALAGDEQALGVYDRAAAELADLVDTIRRELFAGGESRDGKTGDDVVPNVPVIYWGGVFEGAGPLLLEPLERALPSGCELRKPLHGPTVGPCLLLRERIGAEGDAENSAIRPGVSSGA